MYTNLYSLVHITNVALVVWMYLNAFNARKKTKTLFIKITNESTGSQLFSLAQSAVYSALCILSCVFIYISKLCCDVHSVTFECQQNGFWLGFFF